MKLYQVLSVSQISDRSHFIEALYSTASRKGWTPRVDLSTTAKQNMADYDGDYICIESPRISFEEKHIAGIVWMRIEKENAEVFNIIPTVDYQLIAPEYNYLLQEFYTTIIAPISKKMGLAVSMTGDHLDLEKEIGSECFSALKRFSDNANRSTGTSHPSDFKLWCEFLFVVHKKKVKLELDKLSGWLFDNGWNDSDVVDNLIDQFEFARDLLNLYDKDLEK